MQKYTRIVEDYIRREIPLTKNVDIKIKKLDSTGAIFTAPLEPNINDKKIGFAGSIETLLTIAAWGWVFSLFQELDIDVKLYIRRCSFEFNSPITEAMEANVTAPSKEVLDLFKYDYFKDGKARIDISAYIGIEDNPSAQFTGTFAAVSRTYKPHSKIDNDKHAQTVS